MGKKRQEIYKNLKYFSLAAIFGGLFSAYSNCSDINIQARQFGKSFSTLPGKPDLETFGRIDTTCYPNTDALGYTGVQLWPLSPPRNLSFEGQTYPIYVAGNGNCTKNGNNILDFSGATVENGGDSVTLRMREMFQSVLSFRITTPTVPGYMDLQYSCVLCPAPTGAPQMLYSISRYAGDIDPSRPNSDEYCNGYRAAVTSDTGPVKSPPPCRLKPGLVYYFNILDRGSSNMEGYDPPGMDVIFKYSTVECGKSTMIPGYPATYLCP